eukprot:GHVH01000586.1.p1 GENE.GHVH01000586.1~~GHVH01000586.1.p1  ORF type:complete len:209 (+),score=24.59 GHVH01000586.1:214-840(+)
MVVSQSYENEEYRTRCAGKKKVPNALATWSRGLNYRFIERKALPVISSFSDGQGEKGVEIAGLEIANGGLDRIIEKYGWQCAEAECPLAGFNVDEVKKDKTAFSVNVKNVEVVGAKLGRIAADMAKVVKEHNGLLINLGGDHSCAAASISTMLDKYPDLRVIWVDAHADCNTPETSPSGNYHVIPAACLAPLIMILQGNGLRPSDGLV